MCIQPFYSPFKSPATQRLERLIQQQNGHLDLTSLRVIHKGIMTWLEERHSKSSRTKLILEFRKNIEQKITALHAQNAMPSCMESPLVTKPFEKHLFYVQQKDVKTRKKSLFDQCQQRFNMVFSTFKTIDCEQAIQTAPLTDRALFFENCYVIHHNIATFITHYDPLLTVNEREQIRVMQDQLTRWMGTIDALKQQAFDSLPYMSERFKCHMTYKIRNKFFSVICLPFIDYAIEFDSLFNMTLDIIGLG